MIIRKIILFFLISASYITNLTAFTLQDSIHTLPEFRGAKWDSSLNEVKEKETAYYLQTFHGFGIEALSYKGKIAGLDARIDYDFKNKKFTEGSYRVISDDNFKEDYSTLFNFLVNLYGKPDRRSGFLYTSDSVWIKTNDYGIYAGPSLYWEFKDGFIGLISQKYKEEITLIVLYAYNVTIEEYNSINAVELKDYEIIKH
jgi:hypothetical protein